jgi:phosphocarrier protein
VFKSVSNLETTAGATGRRGGTTMLERELQITQSQGLHAQASARLVQALAPFHSQVFLLAKGREVNAKSIMGVMLLAAGPGTPIKVRVDGSDEAEALEAVAKFFAGGA